MKNILNDSIESVFLEINKQNFGKDAVDLKPVCPNGKQFNFVYNRSIKGNNYGRTE